jgi:hypothetical protein
MESNLALGELHGFVKAVTVYNSSICDIVVYFINLDIIEGDSSYCPARKATIFSRCSWSD